MVYAEKGEKKGPEVIKATKEKRVRKETAVRTVAGKLRHQFSAKLHPNLAMLDLKAN